MAEGRQRVAFKLGHRCGLQRLRQKLQDEGRLGPTMDRLVDECLSEEPLDWVTKSEQLPECLDEDTVDQISTADLPAELMCES